MYYFVIMCVMRWYLTLAVFSCPPHVRLCCCRNTETPRCLLCWAGPKEINALPQHDLGQDMSEAFHWSL